MSSPTARNHRIVLAAHPKGRPRPEDFRLEEVAVPEPREGEVLLRTLDLSLDPYMRGLMNPIGPSYAPAVKIGDPMAGGTINRIVASRHPRLRVGELVVGSAGWQEYATSNGQGLIPLGQMPHPSLALGGLGMPGFTAYVGLLDIGRPKPGETVVVAAATGGVGSVVGQIARLKGARVVGIAGGAEKCRYAVDELGFDTCLDHLAPELPKRLAEACPKGIDVYFENVGGPVLSAVVPLLNNDARMPVCGVIAHYNEEESAGPDRLPGFLGTLIQKRITVQGFIILDHYATRFEAFRREAGEWHAAGKLKLREDVVHGLERAPEAFIGLLEGRNFGKVVVHVADA
ncbi:NADP-dependent oxidoreductase [Opitutus sp. ER46]|uniref:NADP-dependent oxidoreductase n=1 Tax=Opitutus sp. ER46 TaxID=2161864 RepID=UPI000D3210BB|nr:NADP-dependent oxidoreductase [Opitutus sp. ER46]PTX90727.1 NADP-dependent oxidoreductase [Opitutus sp. ER46]